LSINTFGLGEGFNLLLNNNNNPSLGELDLNIIALVNALTGMNLTREYFLKKESFVKSIKFAETETENSNKWLKRFN